jgi:CBS domain containing-hemolysin-like protein
VSRKNFSRLPIYGEHKEDIQGYVLKTDILQAAIDGQQDALVADYRRDILTVTENLSLKELFQRMMDRHEHICVLIDEYAGFSGICTMEDIVETLLGQEIMDEVDTTRDMQILARRYWQQRAVRNGIQVVPEEDKPA